MRLYRLSMLVVGLCSFVVLAAEPDKPSGANYALATKFSSDFVKQHVRETYIEPRWIGKSEVFWYSVRTLDGQKFWRVDPTRKLKEPLFDSVKLASQLAELTQKPIDATTLNLTNVSVDEANKMKFVTGEFEYEYELLTGKLTKLGRAPTQRTFGGGTGFRRERKDDERKEEERKDDDKKDDEKKDEGKTEPKKGGSGRADGYKAYSPDRKKYVYAFKHNLYLADEGKEADATQLTTDGEEDYSFSPTGLGNRSGDSISKMPPADRKVRPFVTWSADSKSFHVGRSDLRGVKELFLVNSLSEPRPTLERYKYPMPAEEAVRRPELWVVDATAKKATKIKRRWDDDRYGDVNFGPNGDELRFVRRDRLQRHLEVVAYNVKTNTEKVLLTDAFEDAFLDYQPVRYLNETNELIWWSERSGWGHFYLYGMDGKLKNAITSGAWRASSIVDVDAKNRMLYFRGNAREAGENVYYEHLYRVRFDGSDLTCLDPSQPTPAMPEGLRGWSQSTTLSPSKRFMVTVSTRFDQAPFCQLCDERGALVMPLEQTDLSRLIKTGWQPPEEFIVKAADGVTDLYGHLWKPFDFDPKKKYPIIAYVYPGPQQEGLTHQFTAYSRYMQLAQLGFIVIHSGHRGGAPTRSKAYHNFGYYNLRDYGLADKKSTIEQLAARHSFIDIERVGIFGHSGGAFMSAAALLQKPYNEFFKVAVASAGNHDNNIYNDNWSERYHGLKVVPVTEAKESEKSKNIPPAKPDEEMSEHDDEAQDKKEEIKKDLKKDEVKKEETKKDVTKKDEVKKEETKKDVAKKDELKKDDKKETPKTKLEIRVPTNAELAANLKGRILLVHGDMDNNVHPANTIRLVDALIKANKRFDMLILPGQRHGFVGEYQTYFTQRMWEFFAEHLLDDRQTSADLSEKKSQRK